MNRSDLSQTLQSIEQLYPEYLQALTNLDKAGCVQWTVTVLEQGKIKIEDLYQHILAHALNQLSSHEQNTPESIWQEHVRSEITRTVIENCYPFVARQAAAQRHQDGEKSQGKVLIVLPAEEYHELGARMGADFFEICGFDVQFVGSNTPQDAILQGLLHFQPQYVDLHVMNYYNLFKAKDLIAQIRRQAPDVKILASGYAFTSEKEQTASFGQVCLIDSFMDVASLRVTDL